MIVAYWIAFGPHGPRAQTPPGEGLKVFSYTMVGVAVAFGLFAAARIFAKPPPSTMNKEWEEATNEILRVRALLYLNNQPYHRSLSFKTPPSNLTHLMRTTTNITFPFYRHKSPNQSLVSPPKATVDQDRSSPSQRTQHKRRTRHPFEEPNPLLRSPNKIKNSRIKSSPSVFRLFSLVVRGVLCYTYIAVSGNVCMT